jgi:hypothetical protein
MELEIISDEDALLIRRMSLAPGEAMFWHVDVCRRFSVVVRGAELTIEYRDGGEPARLPVAPGLADWDEPEPRVHRAVNTGSVPFEEVVTFYRAGRHQDPQPRHE